MFRAPARAGVSLTLRGRMLLAAGIGGAVVSYATGVDVVLVLSVMLLASVLAALLAARHRRPDLAVHRSFATDLAMLGRPVRVQVDVVNRSLRTVGQATWTDEWEWHGPASASSAETSGVSAPAELPVLRGRWGDVHRSVTVGWDFDPPRRGDFEVGPLRVTVTDPFALASAVAVAGEATRLTVNPRVVTFGDAVAPFSRADGRALRADHRAVGGEHELTTRVYRPGDPLRRVHWRASARHGELMVRQEEQRSATEVSILLETRRSRYSDVDITGHHSDAFEWAVSMVASLAVHFDALGMRVHVLETGAPQLPGGAGHSLTALARVELTPLERTTGVSLVPAGRHGSARLGSVFAVLAELDEATVADLAAGRGAYDGAVAWAAGERAGLTERLRSAGWSCVPIVPGVQVEQAWRAAHEGVSTR